MTDTSPAEDAAAPDGFPGFGRRYRASFPDFSFDLDFQPPASLTWTQVEPEGSRGRSETVTIRTEAVTESIHAVTWQERSGTTVVQVGDFARGVVLTHITRHDATFIRARGTLVEMPPA